jgi:hypothetical protein
VLVQGNNIGSDALTNAGHGVVFNSLVWRSKAIDNSVTFKITSSYYGMSLGGKYNNVESLLIDNAAWGIVTLANSHYNQIKDVRAYRLAQYVVDIGTGSQFNSISRIYGNGISGLVLLDDNATGHLISDLDQIFSGTKVSAGTDATYQLIQNTITGVGIGTNSPSEKLEVVGNIKASGVFQSGTQPGISATINILVSGGTTNRLVFQGGILVSNIVSF